MKRFTFVALCIMTVLTGCNGVKSSMHYTKGTEYLEARDYQNAIIELEQAVELDPSMARNHNNLCGAYLLSGNLEKAWYYSRQAVLSPYPDAVGDQMFLQCYYLLVVKEGLNQPGTPIEVVLEKLGPPDLTFEKDNCNGLAYGYYLFLFIDGKLESARNTTRP